MQKVVHLSIVLPLSCLVLSFASFFFSFFLLCLFVFVLFTLTNNIDFRPLQRHDEVSGDVVGKTK